MSQRTPRTRRHRAPFVILLLSLGLTYGCSYATFTQTADFDSRSKRRQPRFYLDKRPLRPYREVGMVNALSRDFSEAQELAEQKGQEVGCDLLIYKEGSSSNAKTLSEYSFICGVYTEKLEHELDQED